VPFITPAHLAAEMKALLIRDGDAGALRPFQAQFCIEAGVQGCEDPNALVVPIVTQAGESVVRLVIEYASGTCETNAGGIVRSVALDTFANGVRTRHSFVPVVTNPGFSTSSAQNTRLYADPGSELIFAMAVAGATSQCRLSISGHLVVQ
jgi:hypothetical protein